MILRYCPMCSLHIGPSDLLLVGNTIVEHIQHHIDFDELPY